MSIDAEAAEQQHQLQSSPPFERAVHLSGDTDSADKVDDPLEAIARQLLIEIGEDPQRDGLLDTPARFARWWREFTSYDPGTLDTTFPLMSFGQVVVVSDILVWSLCEHHLLPFSCRISIAYRAKDRMLGLSKFARIAHQHAHRLQVQERLVTDIAEDVQSLTDSADVAVVGRGNHLCMEMRGIKTPALMTSSFFSGVFAEAGAARQELFALFSGALS